MTEHLAWAVFMWKEEVKPLRLDHPHRKVLDKTWRKVVKQLGGNPHELLGPSHKMLLDIQRNDAIARYIARERPKSRNVKDETNNG